MRKIDALLQSHGLAPDQPGKGRNVWYMFGYVLATGKAQAVALHDCDILTYKRDLLARLIYPVAHPNFSYRFCKGFYARVAKGSMNGRACRLLVTPLVRALRTVSGPNAYLDFLDSFRYALAGEFALQRDVIADVRIPSDWGLEMGILSEMHRHYATSQICQVDIADFYDHKHQDLSADDRERGLSKMSLDIAKSLFRKMATQGQVFEAERIRTIKATYYRMALDLVDSHENDATINGLRYDRHNEVTAVETFAENIMRAGHEFLEKSMDIPFMPSWRRVVSAVPDIFEQLVEAVAADSAEFSSESVIHPAAERLSQLVRRHVVEIYGEGDADALTERVLDEAQLTGHTPTPGTAESKWDEGDVMVITYGDRIISPNEAPLRSLNRFLARELRNTINGVHILPFFPYSSDDGFSIVDYYAVNPELGGWEDVEAIASEYKLMADLVINHCSSQSQWFQNYLQDKSPGRGFFIEPSPDTDLSQVVRPRATPLLTRVETVKGERQVWCTFSSDQVDLNFANPEVLFETIRILRDYFAHGILYFRLDAIAYLWKEPGTSCVHLSQTHDIIKLLRLVLENLDHRVVVITETNVPNRENLSYFGNDNEAHLIYNFSLPPLLLHALLTGDCQHLKTWMMSMPPARRGRGYFNFIASHDGIGVRPTEGLLSEQELADMLGTLESFGGSVSVRRMPDGQDKPYEVNISLYDALKGAIASGADAHQMERFFCAHTIVLALEGIPGIYIHSLLGTENDHNLKAETGRHHGRHHGALFSELKRRINIRRGQEAFHPNATQYTLHFGDGIFAFWRESLSRSQSIFALHNVTDQVQQLSLVELNLIGTDTWRDLLSDTAYDNFHAIIEIPPYGALWISN